MASGYSGNETRDLLLGTGDTISEAEDAEFLSASEAVKKLEEVCITMSTQDFHSVF